MGEKDRAKMMFAQLWTKCYTKMIKSFSLTESGILGPLFFGFILIIN